MRDGNAEQRILLARAPAFVSTRRLCQCNVVGDGDEGVQGVVVRRNSLEKMPGEFDARDLLSSKGVAKGRHGQRVHGEKCGLAQRAPLTTTR